MLLVGLGCATSVTRAPDGDAGVALDVPVAPDLPFALDVPVAPDLPFALDVPVAPDLPFALDATTAPIDAGVRLPCRSNADCFGTRCEGPPGCGASWFCAGRPASCGGVPTALCGCDGQTFIAEPDCPGRPVDHPGTCEAVDAGPHGCVIGGVFCALNTTCALNVCTQCRCEASGVASCATTVNCDPDGGTRPCRDNAECPGSTCLITAPGCDVIGQCAPHPVPCSVFTVPFCGCDGQTFTAPAACPGAPYQRVGACAP